MTSKSASKILACAASILVVGANVALAGEITGNGKWIVGSPDEPLNGKSACAFSGQNDEFQLGDPNANRTQSWGQLPKFLRDIIAAAGGGPGVACNPTKAGGGEP
jgi:hypothetical protein